MLHSNVTLLHCNGPAVYKGGATLEKISTAWGFRITISWTGHHPCPTGWTGKRIINETKLGDIIDDFIFCTSPDGVNLEIWGVFPDIDGNDSFIDFRDKSRGEKS